MERTRRSVHAVCLLVAGVAGLVLLAWLLGLQRFVSPLGGDPMTPGTAVCLAGAATSLLSWCRAAPNKVLARLLAAIVLLVAGAGVLGATSLPMEMSLASSVVFIGLAVGLLAFEQTLGPVRVPELVGLVGGTTALVCGFDLFLGLFTDEPARNVPMSPYAAPLVFLISQALVLAQPTHGWMAAVSADTASARTGRRLLSLLAPIILGLSLLRFLGEEQGLYDTRTGVALTAGASIVTLVVVSWRALAQIHQSERDLVHARAVVDAIVENIPHMIFVKDGAELRFTRFNAAGERLLGVARAALIGKSDFDLFPAEQAEHFQAKDRATLASGTIVDIPEEQIDTPSGTRWLHTVKVPVAGVDSHQPFLLGISEDITDRKRADDELRHAKEAAEATSRELEAFSYSVSHDLRAPLRSIDGFSQAVIEDCGDQIGEEGKEHLRRVRAAAQKMATLIDDMLSLSRVNRQEMKRERIDLSASAASVVSELRRVDRDRDVEVAIASGLTAFGDARLIEVLLQNLIGNAWKFTSKKPKAHIEIGAVDHDGQVRFFVKDDGAGFDMAYVGKLFDAFQRLHTTSEFEGSGVGLATVQRIARRHGGRVWAAGAVGSGATFSFTLEPPSPRTTQGAA